MSVLELFYELAELPSAQHRSGLAGLVLMVEELHRRPKFLGQSEAIVELISLSDIGVTLKINQAGLQALFDLTYAAFEEERSTETKIKNPKAIKEVEVLNDKGKPKTIKRYYYDVVVPEGAFLPSLDKSNDDPRNGIWVRLWREMVWNALRSVPATRTPFNSRLNGASYTQDVEKTWTALQKPDKMIDQTGQYYLGAMASNPENVPVKDRVRYQFLLHFWAFVAQVYCPMTLDKDGQRQPAGYVLAIPDVADLAKFCRIFPKVLEARNPKPFGYRPQEAIIDLPEEGALNLLVLLRDRIAHEIGDQQIRRLVLGIELVHAERVGNSGVKIRSVSQVDPIQAQIDRYDQIRKLYWCPWFRKQRLINLLRSQPASDDPNAPLQEIPAWTDFDAVLSRIPREWLRHKYFSHDANEMFNAEGEINVKKQVRDYASIVYKVCQSYVASKLDKKYQIVWSKKDKCYLKDGRPADPKEASDRKYKVTNEAFLAVRSRTEHQSFIDYFVSTLYPFVKESEFVDFADKLFNQTDEIRALTLLALSSQYPLSAKAEAEPTEAGGTA